LKQPKLPAGVWEITVWDAPSYFEYRQRSGGVTIVAGHRVEALEEGRSRLTLTLAMRGLLVPIVGRLYKGLTDRYLTLEAQGMKRAVESARCVEPRHNRPASRTHATPSLTLPGAG